MNELNTLVLLSNLNARFPNLDWKMLEIVKRNGYKMLSLNGVVDKLPASFEPEDIKLIIENNSFCTKLKSTNKTYWVWVHFSNICIIRVKVQVPFEGQVFFNLYPCVEIKNWKGDIGYCLDALETFLKSKIS